jgi:DNA-binding NarL/FixJ family response regulator
MNLLIVDDSPSFLYSVVWDIREMKIFDEISTASTEEETFQVLEKKKIHIALLDIMLTKNPVPEEKNRGGIRILEFIKKSDKLKDIECVMCSNILQPDVAKRCVELGAFKYVSKDPSETDEFIEVIKEAIYEKGKKMEGNKKSSGVNFSGNVSSPKKEPGVEKIREKV